MSLIGFCHKGTTIPTFPQILSPITCIWRLARAWVKTSGPHGAVSLRGVPVRIVYLSLLSSLRLDVTALGGSSRGDEATVAQEGVNRGLVSAELHKEFHGVLAATHLKDVLLE